VEYGAIGGMPIFPSNLRAKLGNRTFERGKMGEIITLTMMMRRFSHPIRTNRVKLTQRKIGRNPSQIASGVFPSIFQSPPSSFFIRLLFSHGLGQVWVARTTGNSFGWGFWIGRFWGCFSFTNQFNNKQPPRVHFTRQIYIL